MEYSHPSDPTIADTIRWVAQGALGYGRYAAQRDELRKMSPRVQRAFARAMVHAHALQRMFREADRRRTAAEMRATTARAKAPNPEFAKAAAELETMYKALPQPAVRARIVERRPHAAETVTKAVNLLNHDQSLSPAQRGELMIRLGGLADRVFAKSDPAADLKKIETALALLKKARAAKLGGADADELIAQLEAAVRRGELKPHDTLAVELKLQEIRDHLKEHLGHVVNR